MIPVDLISFAAILLLCALALGLVAWWYYDRRERLIREVAVEPPPEDLKIATPEHELPQG